MHPLLSVSFVGLVAILYSLLVLGVTYAKNRVGDESRMPIYTIRFVCGGFILVTGLLALSGFFTDFSTFPPKVFFGIVPAFVAMLCFSLNRRVGRWIAALPPWWLIGLQTFRIIVEIQLYFLAQTPMFAKLMTFEGANFDILTGVAALPVAFVTKKLLNSNQIGAARKVGFAFNLAGLLLLTNVVTIGIFSTPTAFQKIMSDPPNTAVGHFPFVWLPMFVVPYAYMLHILSMRQFFGGLEVRSKFRNDQ